MTRVSHSPSRDDSLDEMSPSSFQNQSTTTVVFLTLTAKGEKLMLDKLS